MNETGKKNAYKGIWNIKKGYFSYARWLGILNINDQYFIIFWCFFFVLSASSVLILYLPIIVCLKNYLGDNWPLPEFTFTGLSIFGALSISRVELLLSSFRNKSTFFYISLYPCCWLKLFFCGVKKWIFTSWSGVTVLTLDLYLFLDSCNVF